MNKFVLVIGDYELKSTGHGFLVHRIENGSRVDKRWFYSLYASMFYIYENNCGEIEDVDDLYREIRLSRDLIFDKVNELFIRLRKYWKKENGYDKIEKGKVVVRDDSERIG